ncbi:hypothetical protein JD292_03400 [Leucobacter sp. CSA2]|uniref:Cytotoxic translational repressor of toxin-antitoxin stability system n=1 Tax=Leucobacter edaphi TaxID=2796472 RepID=A0A934QCA5_9MICO|nr:hypothetical protein [Leucobacter edaphi]MBK0421126.1 hypothetical protein [Leucobacter edaphi]
MGTYPAPTSEHHDDFCTVEQWTLIRGAIGKLATHHRTYELALWGGRVLRTRISRPIDGSTCGANVWGHFLREQLVVTPAEFWDCALRSITPDRGGPEVVRPRSALPLHLYRLLVEIGATDEEIAGLDAATAAQRLADHYRE